MGGGSEASAAGRDHSNGAGAGRGPAESAEVDGSIGTSRFHKASEVSGPASAGWECRTRLRGTAGADYRSGAELPGGSRIAARCEDAAGVEGHSGQHTGRADS